MTRCLAKLTMILWLTSSSAILSGQQVNIDLLPLFDVQDSVRWTSHYAGLLDGLYPVSIGLGYDGKVCRGYMYYSDTESESYLSGSFHENEFRLEEINASGTIIGEVMGRLESNRLFGEWSSLNGSRKYQIDLLKKELIEMKPFQPEFRAMWWTLDGKSQDCFLFIESVDMVSGILLTDDGFSRVIGSCISKECDEISLHILEGNQQGGKVELVQRQASGWQVTRVQSNGGRKYGEGQLRKACPVIINAESEFQYQADFTYMTTGHEGFDNWLYSRFDEWNTETAEYCRAKIPAVPANRWVTRASAWADIYTYKTDWITGLLTLYDVEKNEYERIPFAYDLKEDESVGIGEIAKDEEALISAINADIEGLDLPYAVFTRHGFAMRSEFDPRNGSSGALIPYEEYYRFVRKRSTLNRIAE